MANSTQVRDRSSPPPSDDSQSVSGSLLKESPPNYVTFRQRLQQNEELSPQAFQNSVLTILAEIQTHQETQLSKITKELNNIKIQNEKIQKNQEELEKSVQFVSDQYEKIKTKVERLEEKSKENDAVMKKEQETEGRVFEVEEKLEEMTRKLREKFVEVKNLPYRNDENKMETIQNLYKFLSLTYNEALIHDAFRVATKDKNTKPLIIEMSTLKHKANLLGAIKNYNKTNRTKPLGTHVLGYSGSNVAIYAGDYLTPKAAKLYYYGRYLKKNHNFRFCWTSMGRIYVKKSEDSQGILLKSEKQVEELKLRK